MVEMIRDTLRKKRDYEAERRFLHDRFNDHRYKPTVKQQEKLAYLDAQLACIETWLTLLTEDESFVTQRHLVDGVDIPRVTVEFRERWGDDFAKTERTIKTYQRRALEKIMRFEEKKRELMEE